MESSSLFGVLEAGSAINPVLRFAGFGRVMRANRVHDLGSRIRGLSECWRGGSAVDVRAESRHCCYSETLRVHEGSFEGFIGSLTVAMGSLEGSI